MSAVGANIGLRACFTCNFFLLVKSFILYVTIGIIMVDHREKSLSKQHAGGFIVMTCGPYSSAYLRPGSGYFW